MWPISLKISASKILFVVFTILKNYIDYITATFFPETMFPLGWIIHQRCCHWCSWGLFFQQKLVKILKKGRSHQHFNRQNFAVKSVNLPIHSLPQVKSESLASSSHQASLAHSPNITPAPPILQGPLDEFCCVAVWCDLVLNLFSVLSWSPRKCF